MRLESLSRISSFWIFVVLLALFTSSSKAQDTPQEQENQQDARPAHQEQEPAQQPASAQKRDAQEQVQVDDRKRTFVVHLPQGYDSQRHHPVVILLHGFEQDAAQMARLTHFNEFADRDSIIAVYPNAVAGRWIVGGDEPRPYRRGPYRRPGVWGPGYPRGPHPEPGDRREGAVRNQDMQFLHRMLDRLSAHYSVDTRRIYATGLGEGGFVALRMGCNMADRIAAIAVVAAAMPRTLTCVPSRPVPALLMNGTDDPIVRYDGGRYKNGMLHLLSAEDSAKELARLNHCSEKPSESKLPSVQKGAKDAKVYLFDGCHENAQVVLYVVKGGGHTWPGGEQYMTEKEVGKTSNSLNANETIWSFLVTKKLAGENAAGQ